MLAPSRVRWAISQQCYIANVAGPPAQVPSSNLQEYSRLWSKYDPDATMFVQTTQVGAALLVGRCWKGIA